MMRAIFSFKIIDNHYKPINDSFFKLAKLSVELAKLNYTTEFYGDKKSHELFSNNGILFDNVFILDSIEKYKGTITSYSKLMAMMVQETPYICLDFDTLLFQNIQTTKTITFGYPEITDIKLYNILSEESQQEYLNYINTFYKRHLDKFKDRLPKFINPYLKQIPNYSLFAVQKPHLIKEILNNIFSIFSYEELEEVGAMFIEQYLISLYIESLNIDMEFIYRDEITDIDDSFSILKNKFHHYINFHEDENFQKNINNISQIYTISSRLNQKLL